MVAAILNFLWRMAFPDRRPDDYDIGTNSNDVAPTNAMRSRDDDLSMTAAAAVATARDVHCRLAWFISQRKSISPLSCRIRGSTLGFTATQLARLQVSKLRTFWLLCIGLLHCRCVSHSQYVSHTLVPLQYSIL